MVGTLAQGNRVLPGIQNPDLLISVFVQDPDLARHLGMRRLVEELGCRAVESPAGFELIGASAFLFSPHVLPDFWFTRD